MNEDVIAEAGLYMQKWTASRRNATTAGAAACHRVSRASGRPLDRSWKRLPVHPRVGLIDHASTGDTNQSPRLISGLVPSPFRVVVVRRRTDPQRQYAITRRCRAERPRRRACRGVLWSFNDADKWPEPAATDRPSIVQSTRGILTSANDEFRHVNIGQNTYVNTLLKYEALFGTQTTLCFYWAAARM